MRRLVFVVALAVAATAFGQEPAEAQVDVAGETAGHHAQKHGEKKEGLAQAILGHIEDSHELEGDVPFVGSFAWEIPTWRIPLKAGACPASVEEPAVLANGCVDVSLTKHVFMMWGAGLLLLLAFFLGAHVNKADPVPRGAGANLLELLVLFVRNDIAIPNMGKEDGPRYTPYLLSIFFFILFMNLFGLFPWMSTPTGNLSVTLGLALCTFVLTEVAGIKAAGLKGYLAHLGGGAPIGLVWLMVPIEILGKFTKPFALTMRLFANMIAGHIVIFSLLGLIFVLRTAAMSVVSVPFAMFIYFLEIFVAFIQAYVFTILSAVFIGMALATGHHGHEEHGHEEVAGH
jgi:F-type H+-transporting ATPase subunit a